MYEKFPTSHKFPEYPAGQTQVTVLPSVSTHSPPCRQGALSHGLGVFWQYTPDKPGGHVHLDPDTRSFMKGGRKQKEDGGGGSQILYNGGNVGEISATDARSYLALPVVLTQPLTAAVPYVT